MDARTLELAIRIADDAARGTLLMETMPAAQGDGWMDLSNVSVEAEASVTDAVEYLSARGLLLREEGNPSTVRFMYPALPN